MKNPPQKAKKQAGEKPLGPAVILALLLLYAGLAVWHGQTRPIDGDEGFYAAAAALVADGQAPYRDFFYPQGPVLPYLYAPVVEVAGHQLRLLRLFSSLLAVLAVAPWLIYLRRFRGPARAAAVTAALLLLLDPHLLSWNVTVKTFTPGNVGMSWGLFLLWRGLERWSWRWLLPAGVALGLAVSVRTLYGPMAVVLVAGAGWLALRRRERAGWPGLAALAAGALLGTAPLWGTWLADPDLFWFNNYTCHQIRYSDLRSEGLGQAPGPRAMAALGAAAQAMLLKPYRLLILLLASVGWWSVLRPGRIRTSLSAAQADFLRLVLAGFVVFVLTNLLPDPVHTQYLTATTGPLLLPAVAAGVVFLAGWPRRPRRLPVWLLVLVAVPLAGLALLVRQDGIRPEREWTWESYDQVCELLEAHTEPGDMVASFWPGYVFETGRRHVPGMENHFAIGVSEALSARQRTRYRIIGKDLLAEMFRARRPQAVVLGVWMNEINTVLDDRQMLALLDDFKDHYCFVDNVGRAKLSLPCARGASGTLSD